MYREVDKYDKYTIEVDENGVLWFGDTSIIALKAFLWGDQLFKFISGIEARNEALDALDSFVDMWECNAEHVEGLIHEARRILLKAGRM